MCVLNYIATSNHVHLLCADRGNDEIPRSLQLIEGRVAQEFNLRKNRRGAFWEDRYHATAIQTDSHLARCFTYIDLNMVRAHAVEHPREWEVSGYNEIQHPPKRRRIIDFPALMRLLSVDTQTELAAMQDDLIRSGIADSSRVSAWTESIAVGDEDYLQKLRADMGIRGAKKMITIENGYRSLNESHPDYRSILST